MTVFFRIRMSPIPSYVPPAAAKSTDPEYKPTASSLTAVAAAKQLKSRAGRSTRHNEEDMRSKSVFVCPVRATQQSHRAIDQQEDPSES